MTFEKFSQFEREVVLDAIEAILSGKFLWEAELHTRMGIHRRDLEDVVRRWPELSTSNLTDALAVQGCLRDAINDIPASEWAHWIRCPCDEAIGILNKWRSAVDWQNLSEQGTSNSESHK